MASPRFIRTETDIMRKWTEIIELPVVANDGVEIEAVKGLVMNPGHSHISSLLLSCDLTTRKARVVRIPDILELDSTKARIASADVIVTLDLEPDIRLVIYPHGPMTPTRLHSTAGVVIGTVNDLVFDETTGRIHHFEVLKEECTDELSALSKLPLHEELEGGIVAHAAIIRERDAKDFENTSPVARALFDAC
jgi:sporulation protein YlmC with PRC-barrel domain